MRASTRLPLLICLLICGLASWTGCASAPRSFLHAELDPADPAMPGVFIQGARYVRCQGDSLDLILAVDNYEGRHLALEVIVVNKDSCLHEVGPEDFRLLLDPPDRVEGGSGRILTTVDPEQEIRRIRDQLAQERRQYDQQAAVDGLASFLEAVGAVAGAFSKPTPEEREERNEQDEQDAEYEVGRLKREAEHQQRVAALSDHRETWSLHTLRRNTLAPGRHASGRVVFACPPDVQVMRVYLPSDPDHLRVDVLNLGYRTHLVGPPEPDSSPGSTRTE